MKLQGRDLSFIQPPAEPLAGEDVRLLHRELMQLYQAHSDILRTIEDDEQRKGVFGKSTSAAVQAFQRWQTLVVTGVVDEETAKLINTAVDDLGAWRVRVEARARDSGEPIAGLTIRAYDWDMRGEDLLGAATTNADGVAEIPYTEADFRKTAAERGGPDLIVRAFNAAGQLLAQSLRRMNAGRDETVP